MCKMSGFIRDGCESEVNPFPKCGIDVFSCKDAALEVFTYVLCLSVIKLKFNTQGYSRLPKVTQGYTRLSKVTKGSKSMQFHKLAFSSMILPAVP